MPKSLFSFVMFMVFRHEKIKSLCWLSLRIGLRSMYKLIEDGWWGVGGKRNGF